MVSPHNKAREASEVTILDAALTASVLYNVIKRAISLVIRSDCVLPACVISLTVG